jgi:hypothetical protein
VGLPDSPVVTSRQATDPSPSLPVVVLLEGRSDVAALEVLIAASHMAAQAGNVELVDMGGVTNVRRYVNDVVATGRAHRVLGLCDARETRYFVRALSTHCPQITGPSTMAAFGFHVCGSDLEDELIRTLGADRVRAVLDTLGLAESFDQFRRQPAWRDRPLHAQLQRFAGVASGRKAVFAAGLAAAISPTSAPAPLQALLLQIETALQEDSGPVIRRFPNLPQTSQSSGVAQGRLSKSTYSRLQPDADVRGRRAGDSGAR